MIKFIQIDGVMINLGAVKYVSLPDHAEGTFHVEFLDGTHLSFSNGLFRQFYARLP